MLRSGTLAAHMPRVMVLAVSAGVPLIKLRAEWHLIWQGNDDQGFRVVRPHIIVTAIYGQPHPAAAELIPGALLDGLHPGMYHSSLS